MYNDPLTTYQPMPGQALYPGYDADGNPVILSGPNTEEFKNAIYGKTNTAPYAANANDLKLPSSSTIAPVQDLTTFDVENATRLSVPGYEQTTVFEYNMAVNNAKTTPPVTSVPTTAPLVADVDAVTGASTNPGSLAVEDVVTRSGNSVTLYESSEPYPTDYLQMNAVRSGNESLTEYGDLDDLYPETNTYHYVNSETGKQTFVNLDNNEIMIAEEVDGQTIVTIYTTDEETSGFSINATSLGLKVNPDGTLSGTGENDDFTLTLSPDEIRYLYNETKSSDYSGDTFYSGSVGVEDIGTFDYTGTSKNDVETHPDAYRNSFNDLLIRNGAQGLASVDSYSDYYDAAYKNDLFQTESTRFNTTVNNMIANNGDEWNAIDTALNGVLEHYKDLFNVGGKTISDLVGPVKTALDNAQTEIKTFLEAIAEEYSAVSTKKEEELERLAELAKKQTGSSAN